MKSKNTIKAFCLLLLVAMAVPSWATKPTTQVDAKAKTNIQTESKAIPIVTACLLGGWLNNKWVDADTIASHVPADLTYKTCSLTGLLADVTGQAPQAMSEACEYWDIPFKGDSDANTNTARLAIGANHQIMPRLPKIQTGGLKLYEDIVAEYLKNNNINAKPQIKQVVRIDLDGDKAEEVFVVASNIDDPTPTAAKNTYSIVLFRKVVGSKAVTKAIVEEYSQTDSDERMSPNILNIAFVADINGDGIMEVIVHMGYYEGIGYGVYELKKDDLKEVIRDGIGA